LRPKKRNTNFHAVQIDTTPIAFMETLFTFVTPPHSCSYLPNKKVAMRYDIVTELTAVEYDQLMNQRYRKFGRQLFRPQCEKCRECLALRIPVNTFSPSRTQKRIWKANAAEVELRIQPPRPAPETLELYHKYHQFQADAKGWSDHAEYSESDFVESFVDTPFPSEEWRYYVGEKFIGSGYVDAVPSGLSAIYFFYDPDERWRSPGTWNVLRIIEEAKRRGLPFVYLGYYVGGCGSLEYKANFRPNEVLDYDTLQWRPFSE
jgi:leucyl-tRNA---protein transferase